MFRQAETLTNVVHRRFLSLAALRTLGPACEHAQASLLEADGPHGERTAVPAHHPSCQPPDRFGERRGSILDHPAASYSAS